MWFSVSTAVKTLHHTAEVHTSRLSGESCIRANAVQAVYHAETTHRASLSQQGPARRPAKTAASEAQRVATGHSSANNGCLCLPSPVPCLSTARHEGGLHRRFRLALYATLAVVHLVLRKSESVVFSDTGCALNEQQDLFVYAVLGDSCKWGSGVTVS
ncbi:hypothetical protein MRX96_013689 [Rhipicephalus microplus]